MNGATYDPARYAREEALAAGVARLTKEVDTQKQKLAKQLTAQNRARDTWGAERDRLVARLGSLLSLPILSTKTILSNGTIWKMVRFIRFLEVLQIKSMNTITPLISSNRRKQWILIVPRVRFMKWIRAISIY